MTENTSTPRKDKLLEAEKGKKEAEERIIY